MVKKSIQNGLYVFKLNWARCKALKCIPLWVRSSPKEQKKILAVYIRAQEMNLKGRKKYHVDHIIPLSHHLVRGLHTADNLQILSKSANEIKSNVFRPFRIKKKKVSYWT